MSQNEILKKLQNASEKIEANPMTAILLSSMSLKAKELLMIIYLIGLSPTSGENNTSVPARLTLTDLEKLKISFRATSSGIFKNLEREGIIRWDKKAHRIEINEGWVKSQLKLSNKILEYFYEILIKQ